MLVVPKQTKIRYGLLCALICLAPLSQYPSVALPAFGFPSFRIGLYQLLAILFIASCLPLAYKKSYQLKSRGIMVLVGLILLTLSLGILRSYDSERSLFYTTSFVSLLVLGWCGYLTWRSLTVDQAKRLVKYLIGSGIVFSILTILQLVAVTIGHNPLGVLCSRCTAKVFGFPRVNLFTAEPQFLANSLLPAMFAALIFDFEKKLPWLKRAALILIPLAIAITFSRGAFVAIALGMVVGLVIAWQKNRLLLTGFIKSCGLAILGITIGLAMLIGSASHIYRGTPHITFNTTVSMIDHLTLGVVSIPQKRVQTATATKTSPRNSFQPQGLVSASSNDRESAAKLAIDAWDDSALNVVFGVGMGNLGGYVRHHKHLNVPKDLTVYIQYILVMSEAGLIALIILCLPAVKILKSAWAKASHLTLFAACLAVAFYAQFWFFGTYINSMYAWLWIGLLLAATSSAHRGSSTHQ